MIRILYIEDNKIDQRAVKRVINENELQYDITIVGTFREGVELLADEIEKFDLLLLDYDLGDGNGIDILKKLKNSLPVIFITGNGNESIAVEAMKLGAYDYLVKDPDLNYLTILPTRIELVLDRVKKDKELTLLRELLPMCASCKNIRDDRGNWIDLEKYINDHVKIQISHGICEDCVQKLYPDILPG